VADRAGTGSFAEFLFEPFGMTIDRLFGPGPAFVSKRIVNCVAVFATVTTRTLVANGMAVAADLT
jgi:hypothetical protein